MADTSDLIGEVGMNAVGLIFTKQFRWYFRPQRESDFGIDAQVETINNEGKPSGRLLALQIKSGPSYFRPRGTNFIFYGETRHLEYWTQHCLPVFIILHDPERDLTIWQRVERRLATVRGRRFSIAIPSKQTLDPKFRKHIEAGIAADDEAVRRFRFSTDVEMMYKYKDKEIYFAFDIWVNKSLNFRGMEVYFDDFNKGEPDQVIDVWAAHGDLKDIMRFYFPWLKYEYADEVEDSSGEIERHVLYVELNDYAEMYLALEEFFANGFPDEEDYSASDVDDDDVFER